MIKVKRGNFNQISPWILAFADFSVSFERKGPFSLSVLKAL